MGRRPRKKLDKNIQSFIKDKYYSDEIENFQNIFDKKILSDVEPKKEILTKSLMVLLRMNLKK